MNKKTSRFYNQRLHEHKKLYQWSSSVCATFTAIFLFGDHGLFQLYKLKIEKKNSKSITELRKERESLISEKNRLENDLKYIENLLAKDIEWQNRGKEFTRLFQNSF